MPIEYVKDHQEIFLNVDFGIDYASNTKIRDYMKRKFFLHELIYSPELTAIRLQHCADNVRDYANYYISTLDFYKKFSPIENYDRYEDWEDTSASHSDNTATGSQFPMNTAGKKDVTETNGTANSDGSSRHTAHIHGNIGVTTSTAMMNEYLKALPNILDWYCDLFRSIFTISF